MMIALWIYLAGFVGIGSYAGVSCVMENSRLTTGECIALGTVVGLAWPAVLGNMAYEGIIDDDI